MRAALRILASLAFLLIVRLANAAEEPEAFARVIDFIIETSHVSSLILSRRRSDACP